MATGTEVAYALSPMCASLRGTGEDVHGSSPTHSLLEFYICTFSDVVCTDATIQ
jgi:hypothetical protein